VTRRTICLLRYLSRFTCPSVCPFIRAVDYTDYENDSHKIRHKFFKRLRHIELATNTSSSEKFGSIHFATLFEIMAT
jgi:hypothetical protein